MGLCIARKKRECVCVKFLHCFAFLSSISFFFVLHTQLTLLSIPNQTKPNKIKIKAKENEYICSAPYHMWDCVFLAHLYKIKMNKKKKESNKTTFQNLICFWPPAFYVGFLFLLFFRFAVFICPCSTSFCFWWCCLYDVCSTNVCKLYEWKINNERGD